MTESEFEHICRSEYHLSMLANRDGNYDRSCFGFYPHEDSCDNLIPVIERTPNHILGLLNPEPNPDALWRQNLGGNPYAPPLGFESAVLYSPNTPPLRSALNPLSSTPRTHRPSSSVTPTPLTPP